MGSVNCVTQYLQPNEVRYLDSIIPICTYLCKYIGSNPNCKRKKKPTQFSVSLADMSCQTHIRDGSC